MAGECSLTMMDVEITAVCGLSFFFSSVAMALAEAEEVVDVDAKIEIISANLLEVIKKMAGDEFPAIFLWLIKFIFLFCNIMIW